MTGDAQTRPTTEAERALVEQVLRADRMLSLGAVALLASLGVGLPGLALSWGEPGGAVMFAAIGFGGAAGLWWLSGATRRRGAVDLARAVRLEGPVEGKGWGLDDLHTYDRTAVGGRVVSVPDHWRSYVLRGRTHAVWVVETTGAPVAVAVERGPSADADVALGADRLLGARSQPSKRLLVAPGLTALVVVVASSIMPSGGFSLPVTAALVVAGIAGAAAAWVDVRRRGRVHRAYFEAGARFALSPPDRSRYRLRWAAVYTAAGAVAGAFAVAVGLSRGADPVAFVGTMAVVGAAVAPLPNDEPLGDPSNPGTGALRPAAP